MADPGFLAGLRPIPSGTTDVGNRPACDIVGVTPFGEPASVELGARSGRLLLAFLNTRCDGCSLFWEGVRQPDALDLPDDVALVAITKGPASRPGLSEEVDELSNGSEPGAVVMTDLAWVDYRVTGYPFFVVVEVATRSVLAETVGFGWGDVVSLVTGALPSA